MRLRLLTIAIMVTLIIPTLLSAQETADSNPLQPAYQAPPIYLGPIAGYNRSMHTVNMPSFAKDALCPQFSGGDQNGYYFGFSYEHMIGQPEMSNQSIIVRVFYSSLPANFEEGGDRYPSEVWNDANGNGIVDAGEKQLMESAVVHTNDIQYDVVSAEVAYKLNPFDRFNLGFTIGPTFDYAMTATQNQELNLIEPLNARFVKGDNEEGYTYTNNDRTIIIKDGDVPDYSSYRIGIRAGVQYEINITPGLFLVPAMYYNFGITNLQPDFDWRVNTLQMGVDLRYALRWDNIF